MADNSGYIIKQYIDTNPNSPTYGEVKEIRYKDLTHCYVDSSPSWAEIKREAETKTYYPSGAKGYDGYAIVTYEDTNPNSPTYGQTKEVKEEDSDFPMPSQLPQWELQSNYCAVDEYEDIEPISEEDIEKLFE